MPIYSSIFGQIGIDLKTEKKVINDENKHRRPLINKYS